MDENIVNKIKSAVFVDRSFTPEGETKPIEYIVLEVTIDVHGSEKSFDFKTKNIADKVTFFELATEQ